MRPAKVVTHVKGSTGYWGCRKKNYVSLVGLYIVSDQNMYIMQYKHIDTDTTRVTAFGYAVRTTQITRVENT